MMMRLTAEDRLFVLDMGWVGNALKNSSVEVTIGDVTRKMIIIPLETQADVQQINDLYAKKYLLGRIGQVFARLTRKRFLYSGAFELKPT
jgi:hypothetical protein